jgi:hypothetical protein
MWRQIIGFSPPTSTFGGIGIQDTKPENRREMFIAMGAPAQRAAQHRGADVPAAEPRACEILDHLPRNETFDWVDRVSIETDDADARNLVRFSLGRTPQAHALVRRGDCGAGRSRSHRFGGRPDGGTGGMRRLFRRAVERAHQSAAEDRSDFLMAHAGATREMNPRELPRQSHPADRRRQRYDAQLAHRQRLRTQYIPRSVPETARQSRAGAKSRARGDPLADAACLYATHCAQ